MKANSLTNNTESKKGNAPKDNKPEDITVNKSKEVIKEDTEKDIEKDTGVSKDVLDSNEDIIKADNTIDAAVEIDTGKAPDDEETVKDTEPLRERKQDHIPVNKNDPDVDERMRINKVKLNKETMNNYKYDIIRGIAGHLFSGTVQAIGVKRIEDPATISQVCKTAVTIGTTLFDELKKEGIINEIA